MGDPDFHALDSAAGARRRMSGLNRPDTERRNPVRVLVDLAREKGDCFVYLPGKPQSFLANRPEYVKQVLVERTDIYSKDTIANAGFAEHVSDGLLTSEGETWLRQRKLMRPVFAQRNVPAFADVVSDIVGQTVTSWERASEEGRDINLSAEVSQLLFRCTVLGLFHVDPAPWGFRPTELLAAALPHVGRRKTHPTIRAARQVIRDLADSIVTGHRESGVAGDDLLEQTRRFGRAGVGSGCDAGSRRHAGVGGLHDHGKCRGVGLLPACDDARCRR